MGVSHHGHAQQGRVEPPPESVSHRWVRVLRQLLGSLVGVCVGIILGASFQQPLNDYVVPLLPWMKPWVKIELASNARHALLRRDVWLDVSTSVIPQGQHEYIVVRSHSGNFPQDPLGPRMRSIPEHITLGRVGQADVGQQFTVQAWDISSDALNADVESYLQAIDTPGSTDKRAFFGVSLLRYKSAYVTLGNTLHLTRGR